MVIYFEITKQSFIVKDIFMYLKGRKIIHIHLLGTFGITYLAWWIIVLANHAGYLKAGTVVFMLGAIYRLSGSLWLCVLFHAMINAFSQIWESSTYTTNEFFFCLILTLIKISISVILVYIVDNRKFRKQE